MSYRLSRAAEQDLIEIYGTSFRTFGANQAERYLDALEAAFDVIGGFPEIARERVEFDPPVRIHPCKSHIIIYRINDEGPFIIRIRHGNEDWANDDALGDLS